MTSLPDDPLIIGAGQTRVPPDEHRTVTDRRVPRRVPAVLGVAITGWVPRLVLQRESLVAAVLGAGPDARFAAIGVMITTALTIFPLGLGRP
ncbi:hypothetical protein ACFQU9_20680 [Actinomadura namibiensis]|uniref:Uncharacterized protein n=1 Tax=Actinomadura namibiensis TaxID=182080 RepID=A0A7W3LQY0_ACTNM|nr:hypothetical protein [Actinomadura namibiensis]MBA8952668.1 hypothetical protein [Actinomadura namibiensis]